MEYRTMPHNNEAEQGILGSMLTDKSAIYEAIKILTDEDFYQEQHQEIFRTIVDIHNSTVPVDLLTVSNKLPAIGLEYIANLTNIPTTANAKYYAGIVKGKSLRRKFIKAAQEIQDMAYEGNYENLIDMKNDVMQKVDIEIKDGKKENNDIQSITFQTLENIEKRYKRNDDEVYKKHYGLYWLDKNTGGAHDSELTILAARPSVGKTALSLQVALNMSMKGVHVAVFNLEMEKGLLTERMISNESGVDSQKIRYGKTLDDRDWAKISSASAEICELPMNVYDNAFKIEEIRSICRDLMNKNKLEFLIVDYLQLCETMKKCNSELERVTYLSRQFKLLAKELKIPVWVLSQVTRANEHDNRRPKLIDLRSSGSIEQDADNVFFLHDENYGKYEDDKDNLIVPIELIIAKQRNGKRDIYEEIGYCKATQRFVNMRNGG